MGDSASPRLYLLDSGSIRTTAGAIKHGHGSAPCKIPVPWFLITHPKGNVIIDGGNPPAVAENPVGHWGADFCRDNWPTMTPELAVVPQLERLGVDPSSIRWVLQSHLHIDHVGAVASIECLPNARVVVSRTELEHARGAEGIVSPSYVQEDFDNDRIEWAPLEEVDGHDVLGDGTLRCWATPGHTPGHMSFSVRLRESGAWLLCADAAYTVDHWEGKAMATIVTSPEDIVRSLAKLHRIARGERATVVTGHDPVTWPLLRHAPAFYA